MNNADASGLWRQLLLVAVLSAGVATIVGSAGNVQDNPAPPRSVPTDFRLSVRIDALGSGTISSVPSGIDICRSDCAANFTSAADVTLTAVPDAEHTFGRWTGDCRGTSPIVTVHMDIGKGCIATFGPGWQLDPALTKASDFADLQTAAALATDGRLLVGYTQSIGTQRRAGVLRETLQSGFGNLPDVNAGEAWSASAIDMAVDASDQPVLAVLADAGFVTVMQWDDGTRLWRRLAAQLNVGNILDSPQIGIAGTQPGSQTVIVAWVENAQIAVRRYSIADRSWDTHTTLAGIDNVRSIRMMLDRNGMPVIAYWTGTLNVIRETLPGAWTPLGSAINDEPTDRITAATSFGVHVDAGDTVRVVWVEGDRDRNSTGPWAIYARRFDGANWVAGFASVNNTNTTGFVFNQLSPEGEIRTFPASLAVARNPSVFAFATAWDLVATGNSDLRVVRLAANGLLEENPVPIGENGLYRRASNVSLVMQDAGRPVVASSHSEPTVMPPHALQLRRYFP